MQKTATISEVIDLFMENDLFNNKIDAYVILSPENRFYFTHFNTSFGCVIVSPNEKIFITDFRYDAAAREKLPDFTVIITGYSDLYTIVADTLKRLKAKHVGYEENYVTVAEFKLMKAALEGYTLKPASEALERARAIKTESELELIANAENVTQKALAKVIPLIKVGMTESELSAEIMFEMIRGGAQSLAFDNIVAFGENSAKPHHQSGNKKLEKNDLILIDIGAKVNGYCGDMTRTFTLGEPNPQLAEIYNVVFEAQSYALKNIKAGMTCHEADSLAREYIVAHGYGNEFGHSLGHGLGINVHETPRVGKNSPQILEENMVVSVEPGIYINGLGGVRIEDLVVVKKDGVMNLTPFEKKLNL